MSYVVEYMYNNKGVKQQSLCVVCLLRDCLPLHSALVCCELFSEEDKSSH